MTLPEIYGEDPDEGETPEEQQVSKRSRGVAFLLALVGGWAGLDRFYVDKIGTAVPKLLTFGGICIWWIYDLVLIATGEFRDSDDLPLRNWSFSVSSPTRRLQGRAEQRVNELEEQVDGLRQQFNELAERVDFAERMLAQQREPPRLPRGS